MSARIQPDSCRLSIISCQFLGMMLVMPQTQIPLAAPVDRSYSYLRTARLWSVLSGAALPKGTRGFGVIASPKMILTSYSFYGVLAE